MDERSNKVPKSMEASERYEMRYPHPGHESKKCHVQERHTAVTVIIMVQKVLFSPRHFWRVPQLFLTSLMGIAYACVVTKSDVIKF